MLRSFRQLFVGILIGFISALLILGAFALVFAEGGMLSFQPAPPTDTPTPIIIVPGQPTEPPVPTATLAPSPTPVPPVDCPPPAGWWAYTTGSGETIASVAQQFNLSSDQLVQANCLTGELSPGVRVYIPPLPTLPPVTCGNPPAGWIKYTIQSGQNLYRIALYYRMDYRDLARYNCIQDPDRIYAGNEIWVPPGNTMTPPVTVTVTPTPSRTATASPTATAQTSTPTATPTVTDTPIPPSDTPTATATTP